MTAIAVPTVTPEKRSKLAWAISDGLTVTKRNLIGFIRIPDAMFFTFVQPLIFVLLFRYVFGGAIKTPGIPYVDILIPGIFAQTIVFGAVSTAIGLAEDMHRGIIDRFRALPMARSAVLAGRTTADLLKNIPVVVIILGVGMVIGFRPHWGLGVLWAILLLLFFAYALSWGFAIIGLSAKSGEAAQLMTFPILFPLTFASPAFSPTQTMTPWLHHFADHQPFGAAVNAVRALMLGAPVGSYVWETLAWTIGILLVLGPIAVRRYRRIT